MVLSEHELADTLEDARKQGLPLGWTLTLDVSTPTPSAIANANVLVLYYTLRTPVN